MKHIFFDQQRVAQRLRQPPGITLKQWARSTVS